MAPIAQSTIDASVLPTIRKFAFYALVLMNDATAIFNEVSGLTPPAGQSYGRFYASGNPLIQFEFAATSIADLIAQATVQRAAVVAALNVALQATQRTPITTGLIPAIYGVTAALVACAATAKDQIHMMQVLAGFQAMSTTLTVGTDTIGHEMSDLSTGVARQIRISALHALSAATATYTPTSQNDAIALRNSVSSMIANEMVVAATLFDDATFVALNQDRLAVVNDLNVRASQLAPVATQTFPTNLPSLVLAYQLYQDASREPDLVARNSPIHPGFMPTTVEYLTS